MLLSVVHSAGEMVRADHDMQIPRSFDTRLSKRISHQSLFKIVKKMTRSSQLIQCDVFTDTPTRGNALAVVLDVCDLTDKAMLAFATWTNLAETTFLSAPEDPSADYLLRIFTPEREMPFAGHPTLGSCAS